MSLFSHCHVVNCPYSHFLCFFNFFSGWFAQVSEETGDCWSSIFYRLDPAKRYIIFEYGGHRVANLLPGLVIMMTLVKEGRNLSACQNFDKVSQSTAKILLLLVSENKPPPSWNSTSGFDFDQFIVIRMWLCFGHPNWSTPLTYSVSQKSSSPKTFGDIFTWGEPVQLKINVAMFTPILVHLSEYLYELYHF